MHKAAIAASMLNSEIDAATCLADIGSKIDKAAKLAARASSDVDLIAISKTRTPAEIETLIAAGQRAFGENRIQEAQEKWPTLLDKFPDSVLHLVGRLQSNKAEAAVGLFQVIHSVDRPSLIDALAAAEEKWGLGRRYFIQVNIGSEAQKGGCAVAALPALLTYARNKGLNIIGLMAVPPADLEPAPYFALLAKLARDAGLTELSMGMSGDFETAILLGATQIRIGTALFGARE
jgi:PLP dependent protein